MKLQEVNNLNCSQINLIISSPNHQPISLIVALISSGDRYKIYD